LKGNSVTMKPVRAAQSLLLLCVVLGAWEAIIRVFAISPLVMPMPSAIAVRFVELIQTGEIWPHFAATLTSILTGLFAGALMGLLCGSLIATVPVLDELIYPYLVALQTVPKIAIAPLFGYGLTSKIIITALLCFFPVLVSVIAGFRSIDLNQLEMMRAFGATPMQTLRHLRVPSALVIMFAGLEIASVLAVIGAVVGEFVGAQVGLGYLISAMNFNLDVAGMFAVLIFLAIIGLVLHGLVKYARGRLVFWVRSEPDRILG
jgi:NitT/TauT family transport system permease protein